METNYDEKTLDLMVGYLRDVYKWKTYVSKERFVYVAQTCFNINKKEEAEKMFNLFQLLPRTSYYLTDNNEKSKEVKELTIKGLQIAEKAYNILESTFEKYSHYEKENELKYFYTLKDDNSVNEITVNYTDINQILAFAELLKSDNFDDIRVVVPYIDKLNCRDGKNEVDYFEGDIFFLYNDITDRMFYDWYHEDDAGVFVATDEGWRKLLYTPHKGYVNGKGELNYETETKYSNYMLDASGKKFRYVGNIYKDLSVLMDKE